MRPLAFVLLVAACSPTTSSGDMSGGGAGDLAHGPYDLMPHALAGIACGATNCTTTQQLCCTGDSGATGTCQLQSNPMCGLAEFGCDGPEDCEPANPECCVMGGYAACRPMGYCSSKGGTFMCHATSDCPMGLTCCPAPNGSPYALCLTGTCP